MGKCRPWVNVAMGKCRMGICRMGICRLTPNFSKCWNHAQVLRLAPPCFEKVLSMETGPHPLKPNQRLKFAGDQMERCIHCVSSTPHVED